MIITLSELFQFCLVIIGIIRLLSQANIKMQPPSFDTPTAISLAEQGS